MRQANVEMKESRPDSHGSVDCVGSMETSVKSAADGT